MTAMTTASTPVLRPARALAILALALLLALAGALAPASAPRVLAALPSLTLTSQTRYDVLPDEGRIKVSVALTATNRLADTRTRLYYFDRAFLAVQPGATNFAVTAGKGSPTVRVQSRKADHTLIRIDFGGRLPAGSERTFSLSFDLPDPGGAPTRETRIGTSLVTFPAWAFASEATPGGTVTVVFPPGYTIDAQGDGLDEPTTDADGNVVYTTGVLQDPLGFFVYFIADRPADYAETHHEVTIEGRTLDLVVRSWPDDPAWGERTADLLVRGLPVLAEAIGLPWTGAPELVVEEAVSRSAAGYAGRYDPTAGRIEIAYYADPFVALHEAAHAWFDGSLLADRWATEGFASWYALQAAAALGVEVAGDPLTPELEAVRRPLNAWGPAGLAEGAEEDAQYAAALELARLVAERAGPDGLKEVWSAARDGIGAYQPPAGGRIGESAAIERGAPAPDWRGLLDLLEDRTGREYDDLWRAWVVRANETALLDARTATVEQYEAVHRRAGEWRLPRAIRDGLRAWQFEQVGEMLTAADLALDDRDAVATAAEAAGLTVPTTIRTAFEGTRGFAAASAEADTELLAIEAYVAARAARLTAPDPVEQIGLWGQTPELELETAAARFAAGDLAGSATSSAIARTAWEGARDLGRNRVMSAVAGLAAIALGMFLARRWMRDRSIRRHRQAAPARGG